MNIIAFYLPQFHEIPENNEMWGEGFTEWTNVKKAHPFFHGHQQPVEPLDDNYYNLLDPETLRWQVALAREYGIYGFCFYHYWYNGHKLLYKPIENYLKDQTLNLPFCLCWANHEWSDSWSGRESRIIYKQDYRDKNDWREHFFYMLPFLQDKRYIQAEGKPLLVIYDVPEIEELKEMLNYWTELAIENGMSGISYAYQCVTPDMNHNFDDSLFTYNIEYQPQYARIFQNRTKLARAQAKSIVRELCEKSGIEYKSIIIKLNNAFEKCRKRTPKIYDYDDLWMRILEMGPITGKSVPGAFVNYDTTPRIQERGFVVSGMTPQKFEYYLSEQIRRARCEYNKDMLFLFAWNEWAEHGYLEPDKQYGYQYLEAVRNALQKNEEWPEQTQIEEE